MATRKISVLMAAAECTPFVKVGGLADVVGSLPQALMKKGIQASVIMPKYGAIPKRYRLKKISSSIHLDFGRHKYTVALYHTQLPNNPVHYYFIEHRLFDTKAIYAYRRRTGAAKHSRLISDVDRYALFSEAVVEVTHQLSLPADIIHCHDWQTSMIPVSVDQLAVKKGYPFTKTLLTIHNLAYQGVTPRAILNYLDLDPSSAPYLMEDYYDLDKQKINFLKLGILSADRVSTVSPQYAKEILTSKFGEGLETQLIRRKRDLSGIINGIDLNEFNPATDKVIFKPYSPHHWKHGKQFNKRRLQSELGLPQHEAPLYGIITRLVNQKGLDILATTLRQYIHGDIQFVLLGTGIPKIENMYRQLAKKFPNKISVTIGFDIKLARKIYAGIDFFLMPSRFEPCGLGQMIAMRYGTIPIVRAVGGLKDTVKHGKTGIVFAPYKAPALLAALEQSKVLYENTKAWYTMVEKCMKQDFSWNASAREYVKIYKKLL